MSRCRHTVSSSPLQRSAATHVACLGSWPAAAFGIEPAPAILFYALDLALAAVGMGAEKAIGVEFSNQRRAAPSDPCALAMTKWRPKHAFHPSVRAVAPSDLLCSVPVLCLPPEDRLTRPFGHGSPRLRAALCKPFGTPSCLAEGQRSPSQPSPLARPTLLRHTHTVTTDARLARALAFALGSSARGHARPPGSSKGRAAIRKLHAQQPGAGGTRHEQHRSERLPGMSDRGRGGGVPEAWNLGGSSLFSPPIIAPLAHAPRAFHIHPSPPFLHSPLSTLHQLQLRSRPLALRSCFLSDSKVLSAASEAALTANDATTARAESIAATGPRTFAVRHPHSQQPPPCEQVVFPLSIRPFCCSIELSTLTLFRVRVRIVCTRARRLLRRTTVCQDLHLAQSQGPLRHSTSVRKARRLRQRLDRLGLPPSACLDRCALRRDHSAPACLLNRSLVSESLSNLASATFCAHSSFDPSASASQARPTRRPVRFRLPSERIRLQNTHPCSGLSPSPSSFSLASVDQCCPFHPVNRSLGPLSKRSSARMQSAPCDAVTSSLLSFCTSVCDRTLSPNATRVAASDQSQQHRSVDPNAPRW
ncbi:hypothetical protein L1887_54071 [Cichorium endivia]|nr:hypothetical protein L1887_54071 [Cichorium endivia]